MKRLFVFAGLAVIAALLAISMEGSVSAQTRKSKGGITISPALQEITLTPDKSELTFDFSVTNNTAEPVEFALSVADFGSLDESGGVLFVGDAEKSLNYKFGLASWVTLQKDRLVVDARKTEKVPITILNKQSLTPGGHYAAVLVTPSNDSAGGDKKVQITQVASSLLFVKKLGGEIYKLDLKSFDFGSNIFALTNSVELDFQNRGNVHVVPRGIVTVTDPIGKTVRRGIVNTQSAIVLPESVRQIRSPLEPEGRAWIPGTYKATAAYRFDGQDTLLTKETTFLYIPALYIWLLAVMFAGSVLLIVSSPARRQTKRYLQLLLLLPKKFLKKS